RERTIVAMVGALFLDELFEEERSAHRRARVQRKLTDALPIVFPVRNAGRRDRQGDGDARADIAETLIGRGGGRIAGEHRDCGRGGCEKARSRSHLVPRAASPYSRL